MNFARFREPLMKLFSTHPPMRERIARLRAVRLGR